MKSIGISVLEKPEFIIKGMNKISGMINFKSFVRRNPNLITYVREKNTSWQEFYELYDLYGEDPTIWNKYLNKEERGAKESSNNNPLTCSFASSIISLWSCTDI